MCWHFFCFWSFCCSLGPAVVDIQLSTKNNGQYLAVFPFFGSLYCFFFTCFPSFCFIFIFVSLHNSTVSLLYEISGGRGGTFFATKRNNFRFHFARFALKGSLTRDFQLQVFFNRAISNFFLNSRRYSQMNVYQRCQGHRRKKGKILR